MSSAQADFDVDYVDEHHMRAFEDALGADDNALIPDDLASPGFISRPGTPASSHHGSARIRKVSALSDFAPVNVRVKRRRKGDHTAERRQDWLYLIVRWPLLFSIFLFITLEFGFYVLIRQLVNAKEWLSAWRGRKGLLRKRLRASTSYQEWKDTAAVLDDYMHFNEWKSIEEDPFYDWRLVKKVKRSLKMLREKNDARGVLGVLETCLRHNFAGVESTRLYSETYYGTKTLVESYVTELESALKYVRETPLLSNEEKKRFFKSAHTNLGLTALCLSGGASFGYYHFGVAKAFLDAGLLPRVVTGTSAGGLVAALICTRTEAELKNLLVPELAKKITACEDPFRVWFKRFWTTGARFDSVTWARKCCWFTRGSMTFHEAYMRTGRVLNISVIPADRHSPTKLLNYITAPDTIIWSALLASAAVPGILNPVVLMQKLKDGRVIPWSWGSKFKDGSLRVDIPVQSLNLYFRVTQPVVSQVNPHVHLFFFASRGSPGRPVAHRKGKGWRGNFLLSAAEQWLKLELTKNFKVIRDLELLPQLLGQDWSSVFLQRFEGSVTIWPRTRFMDWLRILSDPDPSELKRMLQVGQLVTWPKLHMIDNRLRLERQIYLGRQTVRRAQQTRHTATLANGQFKAATNVASDRNETHLPLVAGSPAPADGIESVQALEDAVSSSANELQHRPQRNRHLSGRSGASTPRDIDTRGRADPLRSPSLRHKWATGLLAQDSGADSKTEQPSDDGHHLNPDVDASSMSKPHPPSASTSGSFLARLRTQSFGGLSSPFSSLRRGSKISLKDTGADHVVEQPWSSDSSSEDELSLEDQRDVYHPSSLNGIGRMYGEDRDSEDSAEDIDDA
ncbi:patatin-domain-containing protein [Dentipellis sp. KUC8613]|nr:patatin-domain-containing protein [Dentipellis sp. KUC8613]